MTDNTNPKVAPKDEPEDGVRIKTVPVLVTRGIDKIPTNVPEYEVDIMKLAHGEDNVNDDPDGEEDEVLVTEDANTEYERLRKKYKGKNHNALSAMFPNVDSFAKASGLPKSGEGRNKSAEASKASIRRGGKAVTKTAKKPAKK